MDKKDKVAFGLIGGTFIFGMWKMFRMHERIVWLEKSVEVIDGIMDNAFQQEVDSRFQDLIERFDD